MLYTFQANVFNKRIGSKFSRIVNITISANNEKDAYKKVKILFDNYVNNLYIRCYDGQMNEITNPFTYNNLKLV